MEYSINETIGLDDHLLNRFKQKDSSLSGKAKVQLDRIIGEELNRGSGKWVHKEWWIDRAQSPPWYYEKITDIDSEEVLRFCSEPLSEHLQRGSAKRKDS